MDHASRGSLEERRIEVDGVPVFWREAPTPAGRAPALYLHGVPTNSDDWVPFLGRTGGVGLDLPGFGRSGKPNEFDYSIPGYRRFLHAFLDKLGLERISMVVHDWGGVGLALAQEVPERIERLVVANCVPLLPGYRWHRIARVWRTPVLGELFMGFTNRMSFRVISRESNATPGPMPEEFIGSVIDHFDHGTQRAILRLYRSAPSDVLAAAGERLAEVRCPALVLWGEQDPYIPMSFARAYADALGGPTRVEVVPEAGHWPWLDRPELIDTVAAFLLDGEASPSSP
ncbi:MAG: alpha/beta fold hydrolase [Thermoleophilaceae bacterium]